jgi:electron transfer flavoprotein beta subunit
VLPQQFQSRYGNVWQSNPRWNAVPTSTGELYDWDAASTYIQEPPFLAEISREPRAPESVRGARVLLALAEREQALAVLLGKQAIDDDNNQTGQMLAALWNRPQATFASKVEFDGTVARVTREVDAGLQTLEIDLPAVITVDLRLNEPRYVKLPDIMKAKKKPLETINAADLGVQLRQRMINVSFAAPAIRQKGILVKDAEQLVTEMRARGLV